MDLEEQDRSQVLTHPLELSAAPTPLVMEIRISRSLTQTAEAGQRAVPEATQELARRVVRPLTPAAVQEAGRE